MDAPEEFGKGVLHERNESSDAKKPVARDRPFEILPPGAGGFRVRQRQVNSIVPEA